MDVSKVWEKLVLPGGGTIVYIVLDGLGGTPDPRKGGTELQVAYTPNLNNLVKFAACGLLEIVGPGITPGSGPGHLALFGYDPLRYILGRGILSALGIDFQLRKGDIAARINFATVDAEGRVVDRRAGRIDTETNQRLCRKIKEKARLKFDGEFFLETESEHRAVFVLRGSSLGGALTDTDPQSTDVAPMKIQARDKASEKTAAIVKEFLIQARQALSDEEKANMILMRGFDAYEPFPTLKERFGLNGVCIAEYPMYKGISRLLGMTVMPSPQGLEAAFDMLQDTYRQGYDFYFLHVKKTDSSGEDGNFDNKVKIIETVDSLIPKVTALDPDVLVVTGDHSTPSMMKSHSWHPVPVLIRSRHTSLEEVYTFDEYSCLRGSLGVRPGFHLMGMVLAHAGRLTKYGA